MRTGGASWLMPFMVLSLYSIASNSVLFSSYSTDLLRDFSSI